MSQPKVLRIGVVVDGRIAHEQLVRPGQDVTLGESARNTVVLPADTGLPKRTLLFAKRRAGWALRFTREMDGKLAHKDSVVPLSALAGLARESGGAFTLPLEDGARGKVQVSERVAVLFQFVPAPPEPATRPSGNFRPKLLEDDDPVYLGFLGMFSAAAAVAMIFVWSHPPVQHLDITEVAERLPTQVLLIQPVEPTTDDVREIEDGQPVEEVAEVDPDVAPAGDPEPVYEAENPRTEREIAEQLVAENPLITGLDLIRTRGDANSGNAGEDTLYGDDVTMQTLKEAMDGISAEEWTSATPTIRGCFDCEGDVDIELGDLRLETEITVDDVETEPVPVTPTIGPPVGERPDNAVVDGVRRQAVQLRSCHEQALNRSSRAGGRMEVVFTITGGHTELVEVVKNESDDPLFAACVASRIERWQFDASIEQDVQYPFVFGERR